MGKIWLISCSPDPTIPKLQIWIFTTVFPRIVSTETIIFWKWNMWKLSYRFRIITILYFINWIVAAETIQGGETIQGRKLFAEIRYLIFDHLNWLMDLVSKISDNWIIYLLTSDTFNNKRNYDNYRQNTPQSEKTPVSLNCTTD